MNAEWARKIGNPEGVTLHTWTKTELASVTIWHVCGDCNTGWMSRLEGRVKPILVPAVTGQQRTLAGVYQGERRPDG